MQSTQLDGSHGNFCPKNESSTSISTSTLSHYTDSDQASGVTELHLRVEPGKKKMTVLRRLKKTTSAVMRGVGLAGPAVKVSKTKADSKLAFPVPTLQVAAEACTEAGPEAQKMMIGQKFAVLAPVPEPALKVFESPKKGEKQQLNVPVLAHAVPTW